MLFLIGLPSGDDIKIGALSILRHLMFWITRIIYEFMMQLYNLFKLLCNAQVLDDTIIGELSKRIGLILGLVMFFYIVFDFIQILIDPDKINDKDKGPVSIIKKFVIVIVLLGSGNFIFSYLYTFQTAILSGDENSPSVIEKLILPNAVNSGDFGAVLAANYMTEFYKMTDDPDAEGKTNYEECLQNVEDFPNQIVAAHSLASGEYCLTTHYKVDKESRFFVDFNFLMAIAIGLFSVWMILMYCISVGMRVFQLAVLQIISPAAFVSYLSPKKDGMFTKFWKIYFATYIDVFIRIAIINFTVLLAGMVLDNGGSSIFWNSMGGAENMDGVTKFWLTVLMVLALLSFAKKAPDLIKQFIPESASGLSLGFSSKDRAGIGIAGGAAVGAVTGALGGGLAGTVNGRGIGGKVTGALGGLVGGTVGGTARGIGSGAKGKDLREAVGGAYKNQSSVNSRYGNRLAAGGGVFTAGSQRIVDSVDIKKEKLEAENNAYSQYDSYVSAAEERAEKQILKGKYNDNANAMNALTAKNNAEIYRNQAGNLKVSNYNSVTDYQAAVDALNRQAIDAEKDYNDYLKAAKKDYINQSISDNNFDAVVTQNIDKASAIANANKQYDSFKGYNGESYDNLDAVNNSAKERATKNTNDIARMVNDPRYKKASVNVKYNGKK